MHVLGPAQQPRQTMWQGHALQAMLLGYRHCLCHPSSGLSNSSRHRARKGLVAATYSPRDLFPHPPHHSATLRTCGQLPSQWKQQGRTQGPTRSRSWSWAMLANQAGGMEEVKALMERSRCSSCVSPSMLAGRLPTNP